MGTMFAVSPIGTFLSVFVCQIIYLNSHFSPSQGWVASGAADRLIKLWDIQAQNKDPVITFTPAEGAGPKSSIYALATDPTGNIVASGSPERVVRTWDPRSGKRTGKLVGHTENIRSILISEDGRYVSRPFMQLTHELKFFV